MKIFSFIIALFIAQISLAQELSYRTFDKAHGMPTNTVYEIHQDRTGYIWLGTDKGLYRFDGQEYRLFSSPKQDGKSLSNLVEDTFGRIWCQNFSGQFFYTQGDSLRICEQLVPTGSFYPLGIVNKNYLMCLGKKGVRILDLTTFKLKETSLNESIIPYTFTDKQNFYLYDDTGTLISVASNGQTQRTTLPFHEGAFYCLKLNQKFCLIPKTEANAIKILENGKITKMIRLKKQSLIQNVKIIDENNIALFTSSGFYFVDLQKDTFISPNISDKNTTSFVKDHERNYWISTINSGVLFIPSLDIKIIEPKQAFTRLFSLEPDNSLLCGTTQNELFRLNVPSLEKNTFHKASTDGEIFALYFDKKNKDLIYSAGLFYLNKNGKSKAIGNLAVKDIEYYDSTHVAIAATGLTGLVDLKDPQLLTNQDNTKFRNFLKEGVRCRALVVDTLRKNIYTATAKGLWKITKTGAMVEIKNGDESISVLDLAIQQGKHPKIFAATTTHGVYIIENDKISKHIGKAEGINDEAVYKIKYYKNHIWWLNEKAIQKYNLLTSKIQTYSQADGLPETDFRDIDFVNNTVYVATLAGLVTFPVNQLSRGNSTPKLIINSLTVNQKPVQVVNNKSFSYDQNDINIGFSLLSYKSMNEVKIYYKINNQPCRLLEQNIRELNLPSLSPDIYTITLKTLDSDGIESPPTLFKFTINKPFWTTFWFLGLMIGLISTIVYLVSRNNLRRIKQAAALEAEKLTLEKDLQSSLLTALKAQMNPHFMFNALNSIQEQFMYGDKNIANEQMGNFTYLTRQILTASNKKYIPISTEMEILMKYLELEKMRFVDGFSYQIELSENIDQDYHQIPPMLIQPFVENAIKHGLFHKQGNKNINIHFDLDKAEENLICSVEDNGVGREKSAEIKNKRVQQHESFSTSATEERLRLLSNQLNNNDLVIYEDLRNEEGVLGTKVTIKIPLG